MVQRTYMPSFRVETPQRAYDAIVERGSLARVAEFLPPRAGLVFVLTTADVLVFNTCTIREKPDTTHCGKRSKTADPNHRYCNRAASAIVSPRYLGSG